MGFKDTKPKKSNESTTSTSSVKISAANLSAVNDDAQRGQEEAAKAAKAQAQAREAQAQAQRQAQAAALAKAQGVVQPSTNSNLFVKPEAAVRVDYTQPANQVTGKIFERKDTPAPVTPVAAATT